MHTVNSTPSLTPMATVSQAFLAGPCPPLACCGWLKIGKRLKSILEHYMGESEMARHK